MLRIQRKAEAEKIAELERLTKIDEEAARAEEEQRAREADYNNDTSLRKFENPELDALRVKLVQLNAEAAAETNDPEAKQRFLKMRARFSNPLSPIPGEPKS